MGTQSLTGAQNINFSKHWLSQKKSPRESSTQELTEKMTPSTGHVREDLTGWLPLDKFIMSGKELSTEILKKQSKDKREKPQERLNHLQHLKEKSSRCHPLRFRSE